MLRDMLSSRRPALLLALLMLASASVASASEGLWARDGAIPKFQDRYGDVSTWNARGGNASFHVDNGEAKFRVGDLTVDVSEIYGSSGLTELNWSNAARGAFINASEGGVVGEWQSRAFVIRNGQTKEIPVQKLVAQASVLTTDCGSMNLASLAWIQQGTRLLVMQTVPGTSACSHMGDTALYVIDVASERVVEVLHGKLGLKYEQDLVPTVRSLLRGD